MSEPLPPPEITALKAQMERDWLKYEAKMLAENRCPNSGLPGPECKRVLCDCFDYEGRWGVSQR